MKGIEIHCCAIEKSIMSFPMGALCIKTAINQGSNLPKASLYEHLLNDDPVEAAREAASHEPWALGMSTYIWNSEWFKTFAEEFDRLSPETIVFAGGPQMIDHLNGIPSWLDFAVLGEGEVSTVEALEKLYAGTPIEDLRTDGLITKSFLSPVNSTLPDLSKLASPFLSGEADCIIDEYDSVLWEMTRGCPFACAFCFESRGKRIVRDYPNERIEKELDYLIAHDIQNVFVLDPTFNLNPERAKVLMRMLIAKAPHNMHFTFEIRAELVDEELAELFATLNCSLQIGLQSSDKEVVKEIGRHFNKEELSSKVALLAKNGVSFGLYVIIGLPHDTLEKFKETIDFTVSQQPSNIDCFLLSLLPGTDLARRAESLGLVPGDDVMRTVVRTETMDEETIQVALAVKDGMDMFFTKGQSGMWIHVALEALNMRASDLFLRFNNWMVENDRSDEEDIWILQDEFITELFSEQGKENLLPAMKSFMELHQGICFVTDTGEYAEVELSYSLDDLSDLDNMSLISFVENHEMEPNVTTIVMEEDGVRFY
ncbi:MAG: radical SAM protein [Spirochaetales bacterium]|nr:radical SAM protein [Candidatus Physcosoma equi]